MKILVIGGTGFISGSLVRQLLAEGHDVTMFTRGKSGNKAKPHSRLTVIKGDRTQASSLALVTRGNTYDAVYDMVAYKAEDSEAAVKIFRDKIGRFIHCSSVSVYMVSPDVQCPITEDQDRTPVKKFFERNPFGMQYGLDKRKCEDVLWMAHHERDFPVSILRPTFVCGPNDPTARDFFWIERILDGRSLLVPGSGDFAFQRVYVEDVAKVFVSLLESPQSVGQAYNVAGKEIFTLNEYLLELGRILGKELELVHIDQEVFDRLSFSSDPTGDVFPFNTRRTAVFSLEKITRELHFKPTPSSEWVKKTVEWFLEKYTGHSVGYERRDEEVRLSLQWKFKQQVQQSLIPTTI